MLVSSEIVNDAIRQHVDQKTADKISHQIVVNEHQRCINQARQDYARRYQEAWTIAMDLQQNAKRIDQVAMIDCKIISDSIAKSLGI